MFVSMGANPPQFGHFVLPPAVSTMAAYRIAASQPEIVGNEAAVTLLSGPAKFPLFPRGSAKEASYNLKAAAFAF